MSARKAYIGAFTDAVLAEAADCDVAWRVTNDVLLARVRSRLGGQTVWICLPERESDPSSLGARDGSEALRTMKERGAEPAE